MTHELKLTKGAALLLTNVLSVPESLKTIPAIMTAGKLIERLGIDPPENTPQSWYAEPWGEVELTEKERDLCKVVVESVAGKIPPTVHAVSLFTQLGFEA